MAKSFTISMILNMVNKVAGPAAAVIGALNKIDAAALRASQKLAAMGDRLQQQGKKLREMSAGPLLGMVGAGIGAIKLASDFETSMAKISTMTKMTGKEVRSRWGGDMLKLAAETGQKIEDIGAAAYQSLSGGTEEKNLMGSLKDAAAGAEVMFGNVLDIVNINTSAMNVFKLSAEKTNNALMAAQIVGKTTGGELSLYLGEVMQQASEMGVKFDELTSTIAAGTAPGIKTTQVVTQMKALLTAMAGGEDKQRKIFERVGFTLDQTTVSTYGQLKAMQMLDVAIRREAKTDAERLRMYKGVYGSVEAMNLALVMVSEDGTKRYTEAVKLANQEMSLTQEAAKQMGDRTGKEVAKMRESFKGLAIQLGEELMPSLNSAVGGLVDFIGKITNAIKANEWLQSALKITAGIIFTVTAGAWALGWALTFAGRCAKIAAFGMKILRLAMLGVKAVAIALGPVFAVLFSPVGLLILGIAAVAFGVVMLIKHWDAFKRAMVTTATAIAGFFTDTIPAAFFGLIKWIADLPGVMYRAGANAGNAFINGLKSIPGAAWTWIQKQAGVQGLGPGSEEARKFFREGYKIPDASRPVSTVINNDMSGMQINAKDGRDAGNQIWGVLKGGFDKQVKIYQNNQQRVSMADAK